MIPGGFATLVRYPWRDPVNQAKYPSKERVIRDSVLVYAEGDDLISDPDEARRQGYKIDGASADDADAKPAPKKRSTSRKKGS